MSLTIMRGSKSKYGLDSCNINQLTTSQALTDLGAGPTFYDCAVQVEAAASYHKTIASCACTSRPGRIFTQKSTVRHDLLVDGAEQALPVLALHLDADGVAVLHEFRTRPAVPDGLDAALLGNAAIALDQSLLLTVPLPTMEPARTLRVLAIWAMSWPK